MQKSEKSTQVDKRNFAWKRLEYFLCILTPSSWGSCLYIHVCMQALLSIRWGFDGGFYPPLVTPLWWVNGELSSQRHGSELMFCNGSWLDEGDLARHGVATVTSSTSLEVFLVLAHGYRWYWRADWTHQLPPFSWGRPHFRRSQEYEKVCSFLYRCTYLIIYN